MNDRKREGKLEITDILKRISAGERRRDHLKEQLEKHRQAGTGSRNAAQFIHAEILAWDAGIEAMKHYHMTLHRDTNPYRAIKSLMGVIEELDVDASKLPMVQRALVHAQIVLDMVES